MAWKRYAIGVLALGAFLVAAQLPLRHRVAAGAKNFEQRFEDLKGAGSSLSPFERVVFSLALASAAEPGDE